MIKDLNQNWGIDGQLLFMRGTNDMPIVAINNDLGQAKIALQGAHIMHFQPVGEQPMIWMSEDAQFKPGKSLRGGIPICWPWFGAHTVDSSFPAHGFARVANWQPIASEALVDGRTSIYLELIHNDASRKMCGHGLSLQLQVIVGATLELVLKTTNNGEIPFTLSQAMHTYFQVGDVRKVHIEGLNGCAYLDKVEGFKRKSQDGSVYIKEETDRIYVGVKESIRLIDSSLKRAIVIQHQGGGSMVVWNPWVEVAEKMGDLGSDGYLRMLCVETANAAEHQVVLAAGESHIMTSIYAVETL